jgi:hypothetical protein
MLDINPALRASAIPPKPHLDTFWVEDMVAGR